MLNRRHFIQAGASAVPLAAGAGLLMGASAAHASLSAVPLHTVVYDDRFADSVAFGSEARWMGQRTSAIRGDITQLWYDDLYHRWREGPAAIAGLTTADALFCLETLGNDAGLRLELKAEHRAYPTHVEHRLQGSEVALAGAALEQCGPAWSSHMAQLLVGCPATREMRSTRTAKTVAGKALSDQPLLVSWLLAPRQRRA